jgi:hypothetical protein
MAKVVPEFTSDRDPDAPPDENPLQDVAFVLDGVRFECLGQPRMLHQSELALMAINAADVRTPEAQATSSAFLRMALGAVEYGRFRNHYDTHDTPDEVLLAIMALINDALADKIEALTGRPTVPPSPSLDGPSETDKRIAKVISLSTGDVTVVGEEPVKPKAARRKSGSSAKAG